MIKELIQRKTDDKKQKCNRLKWEIALLQAKIEREKSRVEKAEENNEGR